MPRWQTFTALAATALALSAALATTVAAAQPTPPAARTQVSQPPRPTIVLVHGAFEDASSWHGEVTSLQRAGYQVIAPAVPLRGVASDSAYLTGVVRAINGPVVLVGHSYGGVLITEIAASDPQQVKAMVYAAAFIPLAGESTLRLDAQFPGSLLGPDTTYTIDYPDGSDAYVRPASFRALFAGDRTASDAAEAAATQRPVASAALAEPAAAGVPAGIPLYAIVASQDKAIPPAAERFEATRAGATIYTVNSAHDLPASHPDAVTAVIESAARYRI